ncbi:MAG: FAD/NAD(P)-binding protein [Planctomycetaceae bacterium]|nr:FAD/NAD(P)-binding protein [Planctomycetaceae bacterium]
MPPVAQRPAAAASSHDPWLSQSVRIERLVTETPGVVTYDLVFENPETLAAYTYRPGQFNMLYLPGIGEAAISISGDPGEPSRIPHTVREAGNVTHALAKLDVGATIGLRGPFGSAWPVEACVGGDVILVAGGIGLAPLRPTIYWLLRNRDQYGKITLLYGARSPDGLLYPDEYFNWQAQQLEVQTTVDRGADGWTGNVGVVTVLLERLALERPDQTCLMTCGPEVMMWHTIQAALRRGLRKDAVFVSLERNMNCALGLCGHCQFGPEFVCLDGPVFPYDRVESILKVHDL